MVADAAAYGQAAGAGNGRNGTTSKPHTEDPATTEAVSSKASPPVDDFSSAFQPACRKPAPSTASVTPSVSPKRDLTPYAACAFASRSSVRPRRPLAPFPPWLPVRALL